VSHSYRVICATCGRDNPSHLVFCQECGQRLAPRVAAPAPSPPIAMAQVAPNPANPGNLAVTPVNPPPNAFGATAYSDAPPPSQRISGARPAAPAFDFGPRGSGPPTPPPVRTTCTRCGAWNDATIRFCVTCGNAIGVAAPSPGLQAPAPPPPVNVAPPQPNPAQLFAAIAPGRVVPVTPTKPREEARVCTRCHGACDSSSQFCRFCGAPLPGNNDPTARPPPMPSGQGSPLVTDQLPPPLDRAAPANDLHDTNLTTQQRGYSGPPGDLELTPRARLIIIGKDGSEGPSYPVGEQLDIGRTEGNVAIADDHYLSPRHARLLRKNGRLYLHDLESTNGLYLRLRPGPTTNQGTETPTLAHPLRDQDLFLVGQQVLRFEVVNDADEGLGPASQHGTLLFGCPAATRYARLSQRTVEGVTRDVFYIRKAETVLGRESGDVVFTEDPFLSRRHASIRVEKEPRRFLLTDLGSSNGTFVQVRGEIPLESGDQFRIGQQLFRIDIS
jgi:pSer/pThr/pTyr-binding forkhead associated (FHA) protein